MKYAIYLKKLKFRLLCTLVLTLSIWGYALAETNVGSLAIFAFLDDNHNGQRGKYESFVDGIDVSVLKDGEIVATATTQNGEVMIDDLPVGEYVVQFDTKGAFAFSKQGSGNNKWDSLTQESSETIAQTAPLSVSSGKTTYVGSGVYTTASMGGKVWLDENNNGRLDDNEPAFKDITLSATGKTTGLVFDALVNDDGEWLLNNLPQDTYSLKAELPEGYLFAIYTPEGRDLRSIFTNFSGRSDVRDFYIKNAQNLNNLNIGVVKPASLKVKAFLDENFNGMLDDGEPGVRGVVVDVVRDTTSKQTAHGQTDEDGIFFVPSIRQNSYRMRAVLTDPSLQFSNTADGDLSVTNAFAQTLNRRDSYLERFIIENGFENAVVIGLAKEVSFGGKVYIDQNFNQRYDVGEKLLQGVQVLAKDEQGTEIFKTKTDVKGEYRIPNLYNGSLRLYFAPVKDYMYVAQTGEGENPIEHIENDEGITSLIHYTMTDDAIEANAGLILAGSMQGRIFNDANDNGKDDDSQGFSHVNVELLQNGSTLMQTQTDVDGNYKFEGLLPGSYTLRYTLPQGAVFADEEQGGNTFKSSSLSYETEPFEFHLGEKLTLPLGGAYRLANIKGIAFEDLNGNGIMDDGEKPLSDVRLNVTTQNSKQKALNINTTQQGEFEFSNLRPGEYALSISLPQGYILSKPTQFEWKNEQNATVNFKQNAWIEPQTLLIPAVKPATFTTHAFLDTNLNHKYDESDKLYPNAHFLLQDDEGKVSEFKATEHGELSIQNLRPGTYTLGIVIKGKDEPYKNTEQATINGQSVAQKTFNVLSGKHIEDDGFGVATFMNIFGQTLVSIQSDVKPLAGIELTLFENNKKVASTHSDDEGNYRFENLPQGDYIIKATGVEGYIFARGEDAQYHNLNNAIDTIDSNVASSKNIKLSMPSDVQNINFVCILPATLGDFVWLDVNHNGLQDLDETAIEGISISLYQGQSKIAETQSDGNGFYIFQNVYPSTYTLKVNVPSELNITAPNDNIPQITSILDAQNGNEAESKPFILQSGERKLNADLGFVLKDGLNPSDYHFSTPTKQDWSKQTQKTNTGWAR